MAALGPAFLLSHEPKATHRTSGPSKERWWEERGWRGGQQAACSVAATLLLIQAGKGCSEKTVLISVGSALGPLGVHHAREDYVSFPSLIPDIRVSFPACWV